MIKPVLKKLIPRGIRVWVKNSYTLGYDFGQFKSARQWSCIDKQGNPIPWYTYPAVEYLNQLDFTSKRVFEYGSGYSTLYWAQRCRFLVSVEDDKAWYDKISSRLPAGVNYQYLQKRSEYVNYIQEAGERFDVVIIDGSYRHECAVAAMNYITSNAMIILDNSDWYYETAKILRERDLIQVDMAGFGPINAYTWITSMFITREFRFGPAGERQPNYGIGGLHHIPEDKSEVASGCENPE